MWKVDYHEYLAWLEEGNTPEAADSEPADLKSDLNLKQ